MASLFDKGDNSVVLKPQYRAYSAVERKANGALIDWLVSDCGLHVSQAKVISGVIIPLVIKEKQDAIHVTAPDVQLPFASVLNAVVNRAMQMAEKMDASNQLEGILAEQDRRDLYRDHGISQ